MSTLLIETGDGFPEKELMLATETCFLIENNSKTVSLVQISSGKLVASKLNQEAIYRLKSE